MDKQLLIHDMVTEELERCTELYNELDQKMASMPKGALVRRQSRYYHVVRENGKQYFAPLSEENMIREIKTRRYIKMGLPYLKKRIKLCQDFLDREVFYDPRQMENLLGAQYQDLSGIEIFLSNDINADDWVASNWHKDSMGLLAPHYDVSGMKFKSKSEELIAGKLEENGFLFHHRPEIALGSKTAHPNFAVLLPNRRRIVYWEHFDQLDDPDYAVGCLETLNEYGKHGIYLGINLVMTYEAPGDSLAPADIDHRINQLIEMDYIH